MRRIPALLLLASAAALDASGQAAGPDPVDSEVRIDPEAMATAPVGTDALPSGFYTEPIAPGYTFSQPVGVTFAADGRIFVTEKRGRVYVVDNGVKLSTPLIDIESEVLNHWDRGLLGFALDPDFLNNGNVYLLYTFDRDGSGDYQRQDAASRLTRYTVSADDPNVVDPASRKVLIGETFPEAIPSCFYSHTIGTLQFGSDGTLLVGAGDGADFNVVDPGGLHAPCFGPGLFPASEDIGAFRSQRLQSMAGKILRVDPETGDGLPSNPFYTGNASDNQSRVWVLGLRNPYRFTLKQDGSTDPADGQPGTLFIGDVGWGTWEDLHTASFGGENFGWPCYEGPLPHSSYQNQAPAATYCTSPPFTHDAPTYYWHHSNTSLSNPSGLAANAIISGDIYDGYRYPSQYSDRLFYADYTRGWVSSSAVSASNTLSDHQLFGSGLGPVVDIRYDPVSSYLYYVNISDNQVYRIRHSNENSPPSAVASATPRDGYAPLVVQFTGGSSSDPDGDPLDFFWDFGDGGTSTQANPQHVYTTNGVFQVSLRVSDGSNATDYAFVQIAVGNTYPTAQILSPANGASFANTETVILNAAGVDAEDSAGQLTYDWLVRQHHNSHTHPDFFEDQGATSSFPLEQHGVPEEVSFLEIRLIATDTGGLSDTVYHYVEVRRPGEADITDSGTPIALVTNPVGSGNPNIGVIADGVMPPQGAADPALQYDTFDGSSKSTDWIGYTFDGDRHLSKLILQQGIQSSDGGWFDDLDVEVRRNGVWESVTYLNVLKPYEHDNGINFDTYTLLFEAMWGDAIRVIGAPGGTSDYISLGELRVFGLTTPEFAADDRSGAVPHTVSFTDASTITGATSWQWDFGDGSTGFGQNPTHTYTLPGTYGVTLTVHSLSGYYTEYKADYIIVGEAGLLGDYYDEETFSGTRMMRTDASVNFTWGSGSPDPAMGADEFSVRWTGWIEPQFTEQYTFLTTTDDGVRLWIGSELVIDKWILQAPTEWSGTIPLEAGELYPVKLEYYEHTGGATAILEWMSASQTRQVIPASVLTAAVIGPAVAQFDPQYGEYGTRVTLTGQNLTGTTSVTFNGTSAIAFGVVSDTEIWADVPAGATTGPIHVTTADGSVQTGVFHVNDSILAVEVSSLSAVSSGRRVNLRWKASGSERVEFFVVQRRAVDETEFQTAGGIQPRSDQTDFDFSMPLEDVGTYLVRVMIVDRMGGETYTDEVAVSATLDGAFEIDSAYPNPFRDAITVRFAVRETQNLRMSVYDILGRRQEVLFDGRVAGNSQQTLRFGSLDRLPSGVYVLRFEGDDFVSDQRIIHVR